MNTTKVQKRALKAVQERYERPVMNNIERATYVEALVAELLSSEWTLSWKADYDWAPWDLEHNSGFHLEVKQSAARQPWDCDECEKARKPRFDIAPRKGYFPRKGSWVPKCDRHSDIYVFAWHPKTKVGCTDHRALDQWTFFVLATKDLELVTQRTIGMGFLDERVGRGTARKVMASSLADAVETVRSTLSGPPRLTH